MSSSIDSGRLDGPLLRLVFVLVSGAVLALVSTTVVGVALPDVGADLGASLATTSWAGTAYVLAVAVAIGLSGWASVRFGLRRTWLVALTVFVAGSAGAALAPDIGSLIGFRIVQGIGGGMLEPVMLTAIAQAAGPARMGRAMGLVAAAIGLGPLVGPMAGGVLVQTLDWRWLFGAFVPLGLIALALSARVLPPSASAPRHLDLRGVALVPFGLGGTLFALTRVASAADATTGLAAVGGLALLTAYVVHARQRGAEALVPLAPLGVRGFAPGALTMLLLGAAIYPLFFGLPLFFQDSLGHGALVAGLLLAPQGIGAIVGMTVGGRLSDTHDPRALVTGGALVAVGGSAAYLVLGAEAPLIGYLVASLFIGLGTGFVGGPSVASIYRVLPVELIPAGSTLLFILNQVGGALGIASMTLVVTALDPDGWTAQVGTTPMWIPTLGALAIMLLARRLPARAPTPVAV